jgi:hypothetical protein
MICKFERPWKRTSGTEVSWLFARKLIIKSNHEIEERRDIHRGETGKTMKKTLRNTAKFIATKIANHEAIILACKGNRRKHLHQRELGETTKEVFRYRRKLISAEYSIRKKS